MSDDFDFGFTAVDEAPASQSQAPTATTVTLSDDALDGVMKKLYEIENRILDMDNAGVLTEHRTLLEGDISGKLRDLEDLILPLLTNLKKNPDKEYIHWPNRSAIIDKQIEKIQAVTRYYERI